MKFSATFVALSVMVGAAVAAPAPKSRMQMGTSGSGKGAVGAAYCAHDFDRPGRSALTYSPRSYHQ
jgi:hypothetical protein